ncbi:MAG: hypothetical protein E3J43_00215 [Candidatus Heimdallarchaeota archaeon]|nr:MAG: hypothetical protein E3J43_00215 [Candidatus Heimdallarchaeota archaeon]
MAIEDFTNLEEEILTDFHEDIFCVETLQDRIVIWFKYMFQKKHFAIYDMVKEMFDIEKMNIEISAVWIYDDEIEQEVIKTRLLIEVL